MKKQLGFLFAGLVLAAATAAAALQGAAPPTVAQILEKYVQATGGRAAIEKIKTRIMKGKAEIAGDETVTGTIEVSAKAPDKWVWRVTLPEGGKIATGYDGAKAWDLSPDYGLRDLTDEESAAVRRNAEFYWPLKLADLYPNMTVVGKQYAGTREAWVVQAAPAKGDPEKFYFDVESGLLVRKVEEVWNPDGKSTFQVDYSDYREVDGVKMPFTIHRGAEDFSLTVTLDEVRQNVAVDDAVFQKPTQ